MNYSFINGHLFQTECMYMFDKRIKERGRENSDSVQRSIFTEIISERVTTPVKQLTYEKTIQFYKIKHHQETTKTHKSD